MPQHLQWFKLTVQELIKCGARIRPALIKSLIIFYYNTYLRIVTNQHIYIISLYITWIALENYINMTCIFFLERKCFCLLSFRILFGSYFNSSKLSSRAWEAKIYKTETFINNCYFKPSTTTIEKLYDNHHFSAVPYQILGFTCSAYSRAVLIGKHSIGDSIKIFEKKIAGSNSTHSPSPFPFQHILTPHIGLTIDWNYYNNLAN